jgi:hypothetical protein
MDTPLFYTFLFMHLASLVVGFGAVIVIDSFGLLWLFKKVPLSQVMKVAETTQKLIWIGWGGMVISGLVLITSKGYVDNLTKIKIFFVLMIGLNGIYLHFIKKGMEKIQDGEAVPRLIMLRTALASTISQTGWWGAMFIGFIHRHIEHNIPWPNNPYPFIILVALVFLGAGTLIEFLCNKQRTA